MKKVIFSILALALATLACSTSDFTQTVVPPTPTFDIRQPDKALTQQAALAKPATASVNDTFTATESPPDATATDISTSTARTKPDNHTRHFNK